MFPPVEKSVLKNNPEFAALYATLTTTVLNPDGSTRDGPGAKERAAAKENAKQVRLRAAKNYIIARAIATARPPPVDAAALPATRPAIATRRPARLTAENTAILPTSKSTSDGLPPELVDLLALLPAVLEAGGVLGGRTPHEPAPQLSADEMDLLLSSSPFCHFPQHLHHLASLVAETLQATARNVARVVHPSTNPSYLHRTVPSLAKDVADLQKSVTDAKAALARQDRPAVLSAALDCLDKQSGTALATLLRALEAKHGVMARSLELRAMEVSLEAQQEALLDAPRALAAAQSAVYGGPSSPEVITALSTYSEHLRDSTVRLQETVREREALLEEYGVLVGRYAGENEDDKGSANRHRPDKDGAIREMARMYRDMSKEVADIQTDLARLTQK